MPKPSLREQILSAGLDTLHQKGFNATSVQDIAEAAGAPKGSFYNHFESKEALAAEVVLKYEEQRKARRSILRDARLPPLRRLRKYFESVNKAVAQDEFTTGCLLGNFAAELSNQSPLIRDRVGRAFASWCDEVAQVIGEAQKAGAICAGPGKRRDAARPVAGPSKPLKASGPKPGPGKGLRLADH